MRVNEVPPRYSLSVHLYSVKTLLVAVVVPQLSVFAIKFGAVVN